MSSKMLKQTFIHTFPNGNCCRILIDFNGDRPIAGANWKRKVLSEWNDIEAEYFEWRNYCFDQFSNGLTAEQQARIAKMTQEVIA